MMQPIKKIKFIMKPNEKASPHDADSTTPMLEVCFKKLVKHARTKNTSNCTFSFFI